jgi:hypothetical protein
VSEAKERILRSAADAVRESINQFFDEGVDGMKLGSPIEELFLLGMIAASATGPTVFINPKHDHHIEDATRDVFSVYFALLPQVNVEKFRIDFVLKAAMAVGTGVPGHDFDIHQSCIAIECDGAAFHHGNPVAAARDKARDRVLAEHFDAVLRFTGSELNANAYTCAKQALTVAEMKLRAV